MSNIEELQARVVSAEARLALIGEEHQRYSDRLVSLMSVAEAQISEQSAEAAMRQAALDALHQENEQLRSMLHTLLLTVEAGNGKALAATMHDLEAKFSAMLATKADAAPTPEGDEPPAAVEASDADTEADAPADEAPASDADAAVSALDDAEPEAAGVDVAEAETVEAEAAEAEVAAAEVPDVQVAEDDVAENEPHAPAELVADPEEALDDTLSDGLDATGDADTDAVAAMEPADDGDVAGDDAVALADAEDEIAFEEEPLIDEAEQTPAVDAAEAEPPAAALTEPTAEESDPDAIGAEPLADETPETAEPAEADALIPDDTEPADALSADSEPADVAADEPAAEGDNAADALLAMHAEEDPQSADLGFADAPPAAEDESPMKQILHGVRQQLADSDRPAAVG